VSRGNCLLSSLAIFLISDSMISSSELLLVRLRPLRSEEAGELAVDAKDEVLSLYLDDHDSDEFSPSGLREAAVATAAATASGSAIELRGESDVTEFSVIGLVAVGRAGKPRARFALLLLTTNTPTRMAITTTPTHAQITPIHTPLSPLLGCLVWALLEVGCITAITATRSQEHTTFGGEAFVSQPAVAQEVSLYHIHCMLSKLFVFMGKFMLAPGCRSIRPKSWLSTYIKYLTSSSWRFHQASHVTDKTPSCIHCLQHLLDQKQALSTWQSKDCKLE